MTELYELLGPWFALPIFVHWPDGNEVAVIEIGAGIQLLKIQISAAESRLSDFGATSVNGQLVIPRKNLERCSRKSSETDPEMVVEWRPTYRRARYRKFPNNATAQFTTKKAVSDRDEFYHEFCKTGFCGDPLKAEIIHMQLCKFMLHWLVNEHRPVDLGFCELHPTPLRPNWKEIMLAMREARMSPAGSSYGHELFDPKLTMFDKAQNVMLWSLDVRPLAGWWRGTAQYERLVRKKHFTNQKKYVGEIKHSIGRRYDDLVTLYNDYFAQVSHPYVVHATQRAVLSEAPPEKGDLVDPVYPNRLPDSVPVGQRAWRYYTKPDGTSEMERLFVVPRIRSKKAIVREPRQEVGESEDEEMGADGLSVLDEVRGVGQT